jgi:hypothetical protein
MISQQFAIKTALDLVEFAREHPSHLLLPIVQDIDNDQEP